jgi:hypothetical protein
MATVTACKYEFGAGRALAFGVPTDKHFRITFNYWAPNSEGTGELHTGEFTSEKPVPQGTLFPIRYNPEAPLETTHTTAEPITRTPLIAIGIIGSAVLLLLWLLLLRGC